MGIYLLSYVASTIGTSDAPDVTGDGYFGNAEPRSRRSLEDFVTVLNYTSIVSTGGNSDEERRAMLAAEARENLRLFPNEDIQSWTVEHRTSMPNDGGWVTLASGRYFGHPADGTTLVYHDTGIDGAARYLQCLAAVSEVFLDLDRDYSTITLHHP